MRLADLPPWFARASLHSPATPLLARGGPVGAGPDAGWSVQEAKWSDFMSRNLIYCFMSLNHSSLQSDFSKRYFNSSLTLVVLQ